MLFSIWYVLAILLFITTLTHYAVTYHNRFTLGDVLAAPASYVGMNLSVTGPYGGSVEDAGRNAASSFYVIANKKPVRIEYQEPSHPFVPPRWGEVSVYGQVRADGSFYAWRIHNYNYNYLLYVLSLVSGIGVLLFFLYEWKITWRGIGERRRTGEWGRAGVRGSN